MSGKILLLLILSAVFLHADDDAAWSPTVNGLRGRLVIPAQQSNGDPFVRVYLELQNTLNLLGYRKVRYAENVLSLRVTDESGQNLPAANEPYDGMSQLPEPLLMPFDSTLRFLINGHGLGVPPGAQRILDFGPMSSWIIQSNGHSYLLSGTLTILPQAGDHPTMDWHGALELPRVPIPKG